MRVYPSLRGLLGPVDLTHDLTLKTTVVEGELRLACWDASPVGDRNGLLGRKVSPVVPPNPRC